MTKVTTNATAKVAAVATGLAMAISMLGVAVNTAHAASLTTAQVQAIITLLSSFGADSATIANVQAALTGTSSSSTSSSSSTTTITCTTFTRDLTIGSKGADVTTLQKWLIGHGYSIAAGATGYFGVQTQAAVAAWQKAAGITPTAGYFGPKSRAVSCSSSTTTTTTTTTVTGNGLKVMLSATSPANTALVAGQGIGDLADFVFSNPTSSNINVTALTFKRIGVSNDSAITNVYLYQGVRRITDSAGVSNSQFTFTNPSGIFTVPAGGSVTVSTRADIAAGTGGQVLGAALAAVSSSGTLDSSVTFPIAGGFQTIATATLATVDYTVAPTPSAATSISPQPNYPIWQDTVSVATNPVRLTSLKFTNLGSIDSAFITNLRLYVDGMQVGAALLTLAADRSGTFDLSAAPLLLSTQSHIVKVLADLTGGASRTVQLSVQRSSDGMFIDNQLNQPVTPTYLATTFGAVTTGVITINSVTGTSGVSTSLDPASPNQNIAVGASSVKWATFDFLASGENVKVSDLYVSASSTTSGGALAGVGGLNNGKIFVNGVQVGSTKDIGSLTAAKTDFSLGSSLIIPAGVVTKVDIYADAQDTAGTNLPNNATVIVALDTVASNAQGLSSLQSATVPAAKTNANTITVTTSTLTATKFTGYGNQTIVAGANNAKIGAFTLSTGSTEGVTVNTIVFSLALSDTSTLTNLWLKDDVTGVTYGTVITTPSTSNSFPVSFDIPTSSTKTIDIYANVLSGANAGTLAATITTGTTGTGDITGTSATAASTALQTITIGSGLLTVTRGAGDPTSANVIASANSVRVGQFNFAGTNASYTVQNLDILVLNNLATSVTNVTLKYKDVNGAQQTVTQSLTTVAASAYATAAFTGLTMYVPTNDSSNLDVYVGTPTIASGNTSGRGINVLLDAGATSGTFRAIDGAGNATTSFSGGTNIASNGTFYVRKSLPTFAMQPSGVTVPTTGNPLYRFTISADPAGAIEWTHLLFNIATSSTNASQMVKNVYIVDEAASAVNLLDNTTSSASTTNATSTIDLTQNSTQPTFQQIAAGSSKTYALYGTIAGFTTGGTLSISIAADTSSTSTAPNVNHTAGLTTPFGATLDSVVWSDRSANSHTLTTSDWINGYLLQNFTSNATTYSK